MKPEFIPSQFTESDGECTICDARKDFERSLGEESELLLRIGSELILGVDQAGKKVSKPAMIEAYLKLHISLGDAVADYRLCFAQNLALYFTAERHGRLRKVPEFLGACDEYRERALLSLAEYDSAFEAFNSLYAFADSEELAAGHARTMSAAQVFWQQIKTWTDARYEAARSLFSKAVDYNSVRSVV